jgi:hypothetical protein
MTKIFRESRSLNTNSEQATHATVSLSAPNFFNMMKPFQIVLMMTLLCATSRLFAEPFRIGSDIDKASADMKAKKYDDSGLDMGTLDPSDDLQFWQIDDGVLIAVYSKKDRKIKSLTFWFADDRGKSKRQEFNLSVISFDPETGVMTLQTKKSKKEQTAPSKP